MFQFSLRQPLVLGTMKVVWLLAVFIAIVTYTPQLPGPGQVVPGKRLQTELGPISCEQSDTKSLHLLQIKGHYIFQMIFKDKIMAFSK